ncbi:hypothetical protein MMC27_008449 [Xylographa pallens]|nr:hypothetical protein [Xylographa pallens]
MSPKLSNTREITGFEGLKIGQVIDPVADGGNGASTSRGSAWYLPPGVYTPRQIVEGCASLLESVVHNLGPDPSNTVSARSMLLDNLASNLQLNTRESSLRIDLTNADAGRVEIAKQAVRIGETLVQYASKISTPKFNPELNIRSPCENHLLKPQVAELMFGPRSQMHLMQVYNEYLHQMVLLRDALLPFHNFAEVLIPVEGKTDRKSLGMRPTEHSRSFFFAQFMTHSISQQLVFNVAKALLAPKLPDSNAYGFQYAHGLVLPAFVAGHPSLRLFQYIPARLSTDASELPFVHEYEDYFSAPRVELSPPIGMQNPATWPPSGTVAADSRPQRSFLKTYPSPHTKDSSSCLVKLCIELETGEWASVDLGQISRGRRYAYRVKDAPAKGINHSANGDTSQGEGFGIACELHTAKAVLAQSGSGLVTADRGGIHVVQTESQIVGLALLGTFYPENIVMLDTKQSPRNAESTGKAFEHGPKFVIYGSNWSIMPRRD